MFETINNDTKTNLRNFLFFAGIILGMTLILTGFSFLAKNNWNSKLGLQVEAVLEKSRPLDFPNRLMVGEVIKIDSTIAANSAMYTIGGKTSHTEKYALITRVTTYYGPQAAVFLYDSEKGVTFASSDESIVTVTLTLENSILSVLAICSTSLR